VVPCSKLRGLYVVRVRSRVASLEYTVTWLDDRRRVNDDAPSIEAPIRGFHCRLAGGSLTAVPGDEYADRDSARDALEPGLRAWEAHSEIVDGLPFRFRFSGSSTETVDEHGNPGPNRVAVMADFAFGVDTMSVVRDSFPSPNAAISIEGPVTASLRSRWRSMEAGHEPLASCAYWLLTRIEREFGPSRKEAARKLQVDLKVLSEVGKLTSVSDPDHGRKVDADQAKDHPLTEKETGWLQAAGKLLILRVLEHEAGIASLPLLTMNDLPTL
jgi:hypothetical protein